MSYAAIVTALKDVRKHPNADRLQLASCWGDTVVVGLDQREGDLGVYFPTDGQLSHEFCVANNLYSKSARQQLGLPESDAVGFFDVNRRVRAQTFRGAKSEGFWIPLHSLAFTGGSGNNEFVPGYKFTEAGGWSICNKYLTQRTLKQGGGAPGSRGRKGELQGFPKHYDTEQFRYAYDRIPIGSVVYITEKLHGTSHRFGSVYERPMERSWWQRLLRYTPPAQYRLEHGTRNVILGSTSGQGYYGSDEFRFNALVGVTPRKGEVLYGELVGYYGLDQLIMPRVNVPKELSDTLKRYGPTIAYTYGQANAKCQFYLYRIVQFNEDGEGTELSWPQVRRRAKQLGVECVPDISMRVVDDLEVLKVEVEAAVEGPSLLDPTHLREGVCVRVETPDGHTYTLKHKSFAFKVLEGIVKLSDEALDIEEAS